jgi:hypothetical protein
MSTDQSEQVYKQLSNPNYNYDAGKAFLHANRSICESRGKDRYTQLPENYYYWSTYYYLNEPRVAHGYPYTAYLQTGLVVTSALYTAKKQGYPLTYPFWRAHYYDWLLFAKRGGIYGIGGGLVLGTIFFGDPAMSIRRLKHSYKYWTTTHEPTNPAFDVHPMAQQGQR